MTPMMSESSLVTRVTEQRRRSRAGDSKRPLVDHAFFDFELFSPNWRPVRYGAAHDEGRALPRDPRTFLRFPVPSVHGFFAQVNGYFFRTAPRGQCPGRKGCITAYLEHGEWTLSPMSIHVRDTLSLGARTRKGQIGSHLEPPCAL